MHNHCLPHKSKLDAQLYKFGTQPHFCIAYVIGCFYYKNMEKFEVTVDYENQVTIIKHVESGAETKVSLSFTLIDCIKLVMRK